MNTVESPSAERSDSGADYRSEGPRRLKVGSCSLEYWIAPLADGRYAMRADYTAPLQGGCYGWRVFESREEALAGVLTEASRYFADSPKMLERLQPTSLFGFEEPEPAPFAEWYPEMIADRLDTMRLYQSWDLLDVVRGGDYRSISKCGSFFDIPIP